MRILVISDIHGNLDALQAVLEYVERWDMLWVLGDLVDYGPEPHLVVDTIRDVKPDIIVRGNHDHAVGYGVDCHCSQRTHELSVYTRKNISYKLLSKEQVKWLASLPIKKETKIDDKTIYIVHGSPHNPLYGYLNPSLKYEEMIKHLTPDQSQKLIDEDYILVGHTHIPWIASVNGKEILNPGSVGQPRDGLPKSSCITIDSENMNIINYRIEYDKKKTLQKLRQLNLEQRYYQWLARILTTATI
ncbi:MAG: metallophosphoesterase [Thermoprotei archaeon]|nr:MAG: diadenosine tetraphosphatase [Thermofilum sp. ex4484_79]RLF01401.1 MAG: metallophosphoesterase [Thermoprotei archaeon]